MSDDSEGPVTVSDLGPSEGHRTRRGNPAAVDALAVLIWVLFCTALSMVVMLS